MRKMRAGNRFLKYKREVVLCARILFLSGKLKSKQNQVLTYDELGKVWDVSPEGEKWLKLFPDVVKFMNVTGEMGVFDDTQYRRIIFEFHRGQNLQKGLLTVFDYWKERSGLDHRTKIVGERREAVLSRLREGYTAKELCEAVDGALAIAKARIERDLAGICKNREEVERFRFAARKLAASGKAEPGAEASTKLGVQIGVRGKRKSA